MKYSVGQLAKLSGVSTRTLRYYDQIGLLRPSQISEAGYREYGKDEVDKLQVILYYRSLDFKLADIKQIIDEPNFSVLTALVDQQKKLVAERNHLEKLLETIAKTIDSYQGDEIMNDEEKFAAFKADKIQQNETEFGDEVRTKYGADASNTANNKWEQMTSTQYQQMNQLEKSLIENLLELKQNPKPLTDALAKEIYEQHKQWLS